MRLLTPWYSSLFCQASRKKKKKGIKQKTLVKFFVCERRVDNSNGVRLKKVSVICKICAVVR